MARMYLKDSCGGVYKAGIAGYNALRAMLSSLVGKPRMLVILAAMDQEDSSLRALVVIPGSGMCTVVLLVTLLLALFSSLSSGPDARHLGRYGTD